MNHFEMAGFPVREDGEVEATAGRVVAQGTPYDVGPGVRHVAFVDRSRASFEVTLHGGLVECLKPGFRGEPGVRVRALRWHDDDECAYCSLLWVDVLEDGDQVYPTAVEVADVAVVRPRLALGRDYDLAVTVFAQEVRPGSESPDFADRAAIPTGTFGDGPPRSELWAKGDVVLAERRTNAWTGAAYSRLRLATLGGEVDALLPGDALPPVGASVEVAGWVLASFPEERRSRWWRR